jgi:hypothetical protein
MNIQKRIDLKLQEEQDARKDRIRSGKWSPSSLGGCHRKQFYNRKDEPKSNPPDERALRVFKVGSMFHEFVQDLLKDENTQLEVRVETDDVLGFADMVTPDEVIELKSQHSRAFWWMGKSSEPITVQKRDHCIQAAFYALQLERKWIRLVYISKDDLCVNEYRLELNDKLITTVEQELEELNAWWIKNELPPAKPVLYVGKDGKSSECSYCSWKDKCKEDSNV